MKTMQTTLKKENRIEWIDAAKAIAIVLMIIGHTVEFGSFTRNLVFSFHMPIFVVLSGYTFKTSNDKTRIVSQTVKDVKRLLVPVLITMAIELVIRFVMGNTYTVSAFLEILLARGKSLFWASGIKVYEYSALGSIWFLLSLFWLRLMVRLVTSFLSFHLSIVVLCGLSVLGVFLGDSQYYLPLNLDVVLAMLFFFAMGMLWNRYSEQIQKYAILISLAALLLWSTCLYHGIYIELAARTYPYAFFSFVEALAGCFICAKVAEILVPCKFVNKVLQYVGKETLLILCIHYLDKFFKNMWVNDNVVLSCVYRMIFDLGIFCLVMVIRWGWNKLKMKQSE